MKLLLDSVILIDHFNGIEAATQLLQTQRKNIAISFVTRAEVLAGFASITQFELAQCFLNKIAMVPFSIEDIDLAARYRTMYQLKLPDALQAAIAKNHRLKLITRDMKDFNHVDFDFVHMPYELA